MNCLRCGREIAEGSSFCEGCAASMREPLRESPYLSTQILFSEQRLPSQKKSESRELRRRPERKKRAAPAFLPILLALSLLCAVLAALCFCFAFGIFAPLGSI